MSGNNSNNNNNTNNTNTNTHHFLKWLKTKIVLRGGFQFFKTKIPSGILVFSRTTKLLPNIRLLKCEKKKHLNNQTQFCKIQKLVHGTKFPFFCFQIIFVMLCMWPRNNVFSPKNEKCQAEKMSRRCLQSQIRCSSNFVRRGERIELEKIKVSKNTTRFEVTFFVNLK